MTNATIELDIATDANGYGEQIVEGPPSSITSAVVLEGGGTVTVDPVDGQPAESKICVTGATPSSDVLVVLEQTEPSSAAAGTTGATGATGGSTQEPASDSPGQPHPDPSGPPPEAGTASEQASGGVQAAPEGMVQPGEVKPDPGAEQAANETAAPGSGAAPDPAAAASGAPVQPNTSVEVTIGDNGQGTADIPQAANAISGLGLIGPGTSGQVTVRPAAEGDGSTLEVAGAEPGSTVQVGYYAA